MLMFKKILFYLVMVPKHKSSDGMETAGLKKWKDKLILVLCNNDVLCKGQRVLCKWRLQALFLKKYMSLVAKEMHTEK